MWSLRAHPGWERRELRLPRQEREVEEERESVVECGTENRGR
ncbi:MULTISPECIES: hypothetical protein [Nocardiopsis]|uniref:Uncharacterized protein n=1 Tax=Nocardiopsis lambiniae TaxID=3075539 RepID=A0ABU2M4H0_9ACTN|nr:MULTISPECIES: hypothetical protein [unclassified Nocardiopsis]MDE3725021.1 hypothetical protein [Nocardiopsis sp. N85]MDT0327050.1 hypothetical protein [Nocardiopsis sp. DSM 44743]